MTGTQNGIESKIEREVRGFAGSLQEAIQAIDRQIALLREVTGREAEISELAEAREEMVLAISYSGSLTLALLYQGQAQPVSSGMDSLLEPGQPPSEPSPREQ